MRCLEIGVEQRGTKIILTIIYGGKIMREQTVENRLVKEVEKLGGICWKFVSPGVAGVPDRLVLLPGGKIVFVELKAPGEKARKLQEYRHKQLRRLGFRVEIIDSIEGVKEFIYEYLDI